MKNNTSNFRLSSRLYQYVFENSSYSTTLHTTNLEIPFFDVNNSFCDFLGQDKGYLLTLSPFDITTERCKTKLNELFIQYEDLGNSDDITIYYDLEIINKNKLLVPLRVSSSISLIDGYSLVQSVYIDSTKGVKDYYNATHDHLTGLFNKSFFFFFFFFFFKNIRLKKKK
jgi:hypothetical protein